MFNRVLKSVGLKKALAPLPAGRRDPSLADPEVKKARAHLQKGEWQSVHDVIQATRDYTTRALLFDACADVGAEKPAKWIEEWLKAYPEDPLTWTLRGAVNAEAARRILHTAKEGETPDEQWSEMHALFDSAQKQLRRAAELEPKDPVPWRFLLIMAILNSEPYAIRQELYDEGHERSGPWLEIDHLMLMSLAERSGGTHDLMFGFARRAFEAAPKGSATPALIAQAHYERAIAAVTTDFKYLSPVDYFHHESGAKNEVVQASLKAESVSGAAGVRAGNWFAYAFVAMGDVHNSRFWFEKTHGVYIEPPWSIDDYDAAVVQLNKKFA